MFREAVDLVEFEGTRVGNSAHTIHRSLRVMADWIRILRILHGAQIWPFEFGDEQTQQQGMFGGLRFDSLQAYGG